MPKSIREHRDWIKNEAVPALQKTPLLAGCPEDFLLAIAEELQERSHRRGEIVIRLGAETTSMIIVLAGSVDIEAKTGDTVGQLSAGGSFGEVAALGLFSSSMGTLRATSACRTMLLSEAVLLKVLGKPGHEAMASGMETIVDSRRLQVAYGLPLTGLEISASPEDVVVRAISLLAERIRVSPNDVYMPISDTDPNGACVSFLVRGRGSVDIGADSVVATQLFQGAVVPEGILAGCKAKIRAETECEFYRMRKHDFALAVASQSIQDWYWRYKLYERDACERISARLASVHGLLNSGAPTVRDQEIQAYITHRRFCFSRAKQLRHGEEPQARPGLPSMRSTASCSSLMRSSQSSFSAAHSGQGRSLNSYSALRLPDLKGGSAASTSSSGFGEPSRSISEPRAAAAK